MINQNIHSIIIFYGCSSVLTPSLMPEFQVSLLLGLSMPCTVASPTITLVNTDWPLMLIQGLFPCPSRSAQHRIQDQNCHPPLASPSHSKQSTKLLPRKWFKSFVSHLSPFCWHTGDPQPFRSYFRLKQSG